MASQCVIINMLAPANIISTNITPNKTTCTEPCDLTVDVTWTNIGDVEGMFIPSIKIDGISISPAQYSFESLAAGIESSAYTFTITGLTEGNHTICPDPDTGTACITITVEKVAAAGFSTAGMIIVAGLAIGAVYAAIKRMET